jgi:hypothetical protein
MLVLTYRTGASGGQDCSVIGEGLVTSFFQGMGKMLPRSAYRQSIIPIYVTVQPDLYPLPYKPVYAPGFSGQHPPVSGCHPADTGSTVFPNMTTNLYYRV